MSISKRIKNSLILWSKTSLAGSFILGVMVIIGVVGMTFPQTTMADFAKTTNATDASYVAKTSNEAKKVATTIKVKVTAYSSSWDETTGVPGKAGVITASGKNVSPEIIANNKLPFGTRVMFPKLYGNKIFIVGDRMAQWKSDNHVDLFMTSKALALNFGVRTAEMQILED